MGGVYTAYGPHETQGGLASLYRKVHRARKEPPNKLKIRDVVAFGVQKHGMRPKPAISFAVVLESGQVLQQAGVMGGISAGVAEPNTHASIPEAISFFDANVRPRLKGMNVGRQDDITNLLVSLDGELRGDSIRPLFSHVGSELSVGVSMATTIALAERLGVPVEILLNYRYNEFALTQGLADGVRPMTIPVNYSVVWEGGKHGAAQTLPELLALGIIKNGSRFPERFNDPALISSGNKDILLAAVPPQELQIAVFAETWERSQAIGIKLTKVYETLLRKNGITTITGAESGFTTKQVKTADGKLITLELVLDMLNQAVDSMGGDAKYIRYALDIAASEMYIPEIDTYYIGPEAAGNADGLVDHVGFAKYKMRLVEKYPRFFSIEDWADENQPAHWDSIQAILPTHVGISDDNTVSNAALIRKFAAVQNAHLQKPNQSAEERAMIDAVATSHNLGNVVVFSHRGTRPELEVYTAQAAIGMGAFAGKWTLYGVGRGALIAVSNQADAVYNRGPYSNVQLPYQGAMALDPKGPYAEVGWAQGVRAGVLG